jgi:hypothetical protein
MVTSCLESSRDDRIQEELMTEPVQIRAEPTPNPNSAKFVLNREVPGGEMKSYMRKEDAAGDPLGEALFALEGVESVFMIANFITVNKAESSDWAELVPHVEETILAHL